MCLNSANHVKREWKTSHGINATLAELSSSRAKKKNKKTKNSSCTLQTDRDHSGTFFLSSKKKKSCCYTMAVCWLVDKPKKKRMWNKLCFARVSVRSVKAPKKKKFFLKARCKVSTLFFIGITSQIATVLAVQAYGPTLTLTKGKQWGQMGFKIRNL